MSDIQQQMLNDIAIIVAGKTYRGQGHRRDIVNEAHRRLNDYGNALISREHANRDVEVSRNKLAAHKFLLDAISADEIVYGEKKEDNV